MIRVAGLHDQVDAGVDRARAPTAAPRSEIHRRASAGAHRRRWSSARRAASSTSCARRSPSTASASSALDDIVREDRGRRSTSASSARSSRCSRRSPSGSGGPFPYISNLSLSRSPSSSATRRPSQTTFARVKVPEGDAPALRAGRRRRGRRFVPLEDVIAAQPRRALPGHGDPRPRRLPRHARRRLRGLRRGRRPPRGGRGRAAPAPLRRGRARRGRARA